MPIEPKQRNCAIAPPSSPTRASLRPFPSLPAPSITSSFFSPPLSLASPSWHSQPRRDPGGRDCCAARGMGEQTTHRRHRRHRPQPALLHSPPPPPPDLQATYMCRSEAVGVFFFPSSSRQDTLPDEWREGGGEARRETGRNKEKDSRHDRREDEPWLRGGPLRCASHPPGRRGARCEDFPFRQVSRLSS